MSHLIYLLLALPMLAAASYIPALDSFALSQRQDLSDLAPGSAVTGAPGRAATYDYIVVGGGTAGIAVAARLAAKRFTVGLIEAGGLYKLEFPLAVIPAADNIGSGSDVSKSRTPIDWGFVAKAVPGANYRDIHYPRGKCLGGSSAANYMIYQRPTRETMQRWAEEVNDSSYLFDEVLPFYKQSIRFTPPNKKIRAANATARFEQNAFNAHKGGPLDVTYANYASPFSSWMKLGLKAIGLKETDDFNSGSLAGYQYCSSTIRPRDQTRSSSHSSYLKGGISMRRMTTYPHTLAKRILFDSQKKAIGVQVKTAVLTYSLQAKREVILSAGAFQSPQLLMVSGIGPAETLSEYGIDVISDLPGVGQNMWDHILFGPSYRVKVETLTKLANNVVYLTSKFLEYTLHHKGPLTNPGADLLAWEKVPDDVRCHFSAQTQADLDQFPSDWPEIEYLAGSGFVGNNTDLMSTQPKDGYEYGTILGSLVAPTSRGNVTIKSTDTADLPVIQPNWLGTETDQQVAVATYRRIREAFDSKEMAPVVIGPEYFPGKQYDTDAKVLEVIKNSMMTVYHAACTCKMGRPADSMAVVDSQARVFGVKGLRVVDASAFPLLPPGHPQSTVYMLAEKIAANIMASG